METVILLDASLLGVQHGKAPMSALALVVKGDVDDLVRLADSGETGGRFVGLLAVDLEVQRVEDFCAWGSAGAGNVLEQQVQHVICQLCSGIAELLLGAL